MQANGVDPHGYLTAVPTAIVNGHRQSDIDALPRGTSPRPDVQILHGST